MKKQVIVVHGGDPGRPYKEFLADLKREKADADDFKASKGWKSVMQERLGRGFEVFNPEMPNSANAMYVEWKIWFDKLVPFIKADAVFVGHSLGGIFLAKYLSENKLPFMSRGVFLISAPYRRQKNGKPKYFHGFFFKKNLDVISKQAKEIYLYHSMDDSIVDFSSLKKFQKELPNAHVITMKNRGHFIDKEFPELVKAIKSL